MVASPRRRHNRTMKLHGYRESERQRPMLEPTHALETPNRA